MRPRAFRLAEAEAAELQAAYLHCQEAAAKTRYQAVRLYGTGYTVGQIQDICGCSRTSLMEWAKAYRERGVAALLDRRRGGNRAKLTPEQIEAVQDRVPIYAPAHLRARPSARQGRLHRRRAVLERRRSGASPIWSVADLACLLERDFGVTYDSRTSYRTLMQRCGLSCQRPAKQYKSHSQFKLMDFEETLEKKTGGRGPGGSRHRDPGRR